MSFSTKVLIAAFIIGCISGNETIGMICILVMFVIFIAAAVSNTLEEIGWDDDDNNSGGGE